MTALICCICTAAEPAGESPAESIKNKIGESELALRLVFLGDAGEPSEEFLKTAKTWISIEPEKTVAAFLGDNAYPDGLAGPDSAKAHEHLAKLLEMIRICGVKSIFTAGNHDYGPGNEDTTALENQISAVTRALPNASYLPVSGCPGPARIEHEGVSIIVLNSTPWFITMQRPTHKCRSIPQAVDSLKRMLQVAKGPTVLISHYPVFSYGRHAGYYTWKEQLFPLTNKVGWLYIPLPLVGSIYLLARSHVFPSKQDFRSREYTDYRDHIMGAISSYKGKNPLFFVSGHEHNMQVINHEDKGLFLIGGAGSKWKLKNVRSGKETLFATAREGFLVLDFHAGGPVIVNAIEAGRMQPVYSNEISPSDSEENEGRAH